MTSDKQAGGDVAEGSRLCLSSWTSLLRHGTRIQSSILLAVVPAPWCSFLQLTRFFLRNVAIDLQGFRAPQAVMMNAVAPAAIF